MTMTDTKPDNASAVDDAGDAVAVPLTGLADVVTTGDHKSLGMMYIRVSLLFGIVVAAVAAVVALDRADATSVFASADHLFQGNTFAMVGLALLVVAPLLVGLGTAVVPLQVGSPAIAFPRAAAAAFWGWLVGAGIFCGSYIIDGGFGGFEGRTRIESVELTLLATAMMVVALLLGILCIATTVIALRPSGMKLHQVPAFAWSMMVAGVMWMLSMPVLLANLAIVWADARRGIDAVSFGQSANIWDQIEWAFTGPQAFVFAIPVLGLAAEMVPVATKQRQAQYSILLGAIAAFGVFTFGAFLQSRVVAEDLFAEGVPAYLNTAEGTVRWAPYNISLLAQAGVLLLAGLVVFAALANSLRLGGRNVRAPQAWLLGVLSAVLMLLAAATSYALVSLEPLELTGEADLGAANYAILAGLIGGVAGVYYWMPKLTGRRLINGGGALAGLALLGGTVLASLTLVIAGFFKNTDGGDIDTLEALRLGSGIGFVLVAAGLALVKLDLLRIMFTSSDDRVGDDPWDGHTLEWATSSPPPAGNFAEPVAAVTSERPLLDLREANDGEDA